MRKPNNYENTQAQGEFTPVELGGHTLVIKQVEERMSKTNKPMIVVFFDFAPGDKQAGYFAESFKNDIRPDKKWSNQATQYILTEDENGDCSRSFKTFLTCVEHSNKGFTTQWGDNFGQQFKGSKIKHIGWRLLRLWKMVEQMKVEEIAVRQEVRQMLSEAGINRNTLREMTQQILREEIKKQVKYAVEHINVNDVVRYELTSYEGRSALESWLDGTEIKAVIVDPTAASFIAELRKRGFRVIKAKNDVEDGIRLVSTKLNLIKIIFSNVCQNTIKEFASYIWDAKAAERGEDKPIKQYDHAMDAVRYFVYTIFGDKPRLNRNLKGGL